MTLFQALKKAQNELSCVTDDFRYDAWVLFSHCFELNRNEYFLKLQDEADDDRTQRLFELVKKRKNGLPLQYIVGKWSFLDCDFFVGEGVLIPRADTECLVEKAAGIIREKGVKTVYDLCAGTGCIGICLAKMFDFLNVVAFEKSNEAIKYIERNIALNGVENVKIVQGDLFEGGEKYDLTSCEMIVSNPPYIRSGEISSLQKEVLHEPRMALDGGEDGLMFYRVLKEKWFDTIDSCKSILMECGEDQADEVRAIFSQYKTVEFVKDLSKIRRDVCVFKDGEI